MTEKKNVPKHAAKPTKPAEEPIKEETIETGEGTEEMKTVTIPVKEYAEQLKELDEWKKQSQQFMEGWQHERADFSNYRKRIERDREETRQNITAEVVKKYLEVLDDILRALNAAPVDGQAGNWAQGIELIARKLQNILEAEGIQRIPAEGAQFDPRKHEAVTYEESPDHQSGQIIEVIKQGYTIGDRVIRPALVRVAK